MANNRHDLVGNAEDQIAFPTVATAATATDYVAIWVAPYDCLVQTVELFWTDAITGANTHTFHMNLDNHGATELANVDYVSGTNAAAVTSVALYTPASPGLTVTSGQTLRLERELIGNGQATPMGIMVVSYQGD